jgi:peptide/nickel transport system permease protein
MLRYIFKRVLIFIPTLFAISLVTFFISVNAPGDPLEQILNKNSEGEGLKQDNLASEKAYREARHTYGFDLPLFYFTFCSAAYPDTLYKIPNENHRYTLERLSWQQGNWRNVSDWYLELGRLDHCLNTVDRTPSNEVILTEAKGTIYALYENFTATKLNFLLQRLSTFINDSSLQPGCSQAYAKLNSKYYTMMGNTEAIKKYIPVIHWYGTNNQYHHWFSDFIGGDFGTSYQDKRPVSSVIRDAWPWTTGISLLSVVLAYLISIPLGVKAAANKGSVSEKISTSTLFFLYSLPNFWIATMLVIFLCGGDWLHWFPGPGAAPVPDDSSFFYKIWENSYRLILPLICWTYGSLAFISRQMRGGMLNAIHQDYIRTARAKGLDEKTVIWKHALKNSLLPVITLFSEIFPLAVSGSVVLEHIFNIPGMGQLSYDALFSKNYPVIFAVMMITAFLTLLGSLVADILYALVDPRISFSKTSTKA